jgi:hypothetical protein
MYCLVRADYYYYGPTALAEGLALNGCLRTMHI